MKKQSREIKSSKDKSILFEYLAGIEKYPFSVTIGPCESPKTVRQNKLQRKWVDEISSQGDGTFDDAEYTRGYCKLHFGVRILLHENESFRVQYEQTIKHLTYEQKIMIMQEPMDFPVTRLMTSKQKSQYLDRMYVFFTGKGFILTDPGLQGMEER